MNPIKKTGVMFKDYDKQTNEQLIWNLEQMEVIITNAVEELVERLDISVEKACLLIDIEENEYELMMDNYWKRMKEIRERIKEEKK